MFTTGWRAPSPSELAGLDAVIAEVYPALVPTTPQPGETPPDRVQVRTLCEHWSRLDEAGRLAPLFGADWAGSAAAQFNALYDQFDLHARGMSDALDGIGQLLARAGVTYAQAEAQVTASFR